MHSENSLKNSKVHLYSHLKRTHGVYIDVKRLYICMYDPLSKQKPTSSSFFCVLYFNSRFMQMGLLSYRGEKVGNQIGSNVIQFTKQGMNR